MKPLRHRLRRLHGSLLIHTVTLTLTLSLGLAACGGGSTDRPSGTPSDPSSPGNAAPAPAVSLTAAPGSGQHSTLSWNGGSTGGTWQLERRREADPDFTVLGTVDSSSGLWLDSGLAADTTYSYRLSNTQGQVLATASLRTGNEAVLTTAAPEAVGDALSLPYTPATTRLALLAGSGHIEVPAGSFSQAGTAGVQAISNPLPAGLADADGLGLSISLPERPAHTLTLTLSYEADEDPNEVLQDRLAIQQADGSCR